MFLSELLGAVAAEPALQGVQVRLDDDVELSGIAHDSRRTGPGMLFCCVPGANFDGHELAVDAVAAGAVALLCERPLGLGVAEVQVSSVREAMGPVAAAICGRPSDRLTVVGVTGTNGKTTTVHLLASILEAAGRRVGVIGTLTGARTTPEAPELQQQFAAMLADGVEAVAMEVSSHALDLHRVDGTRFDVAVFTNLSRDHLDHHGNMEAYFAAKARLFEPDLARSAVLNLDDPHGRLLRDAASIPAAGYSLEDADDLRVTVDGSAFRWRGVEVEVPLPGRFNVSNALAAATAAEAIGIAPEVIASGLRGAGPVPGRFELVRLGQPYLAAVDFAHTPDGLEQLLGSARELAGEGRVIVVFGAGGDRDRTKRPLMGQVAARLADLIVVTTDNPRHEDPAAIIEEVERGMEDPADLTTEPDRRRAIELAVAAARPGDVLLVAGKGHETTQIVGDDVASFDDRLVLAEAIRAAEAVS